jgi:hypothetical protein
VDVKPLEPIVFDAYPSTQEISAVISISHKPIDSNAITEDSRTIVVPATNPIYWRAAVLFPTACTLIAAIVSSAVPSLPRIPLDITIILTLGFVAVVMSAWTTKPQPKPAAAIIRRPKNVIELPRYQVTIQPSAIRCFTQYTDTYAGAEDRIAATQYGMLVESPGTQSFAFYEIAMIDALDFRRTLRKLYDVQHCRFIRDESSGRPKYIGEPGT